MCCRAHNRENPGHCKLLFKSFMTSLKFLSSSHKLSCKSLHLSSDRVASRLSSARTIKVHWVLVKTESDCWFQLQYQRWFITAHTRRWKMTLYVFVFYSLLYQISLQQSTQFFLSYTVTEPVRNTLIIFFIPKWCTRLYFSFWVSFLLVLFICENKYIAYRSLFLYFKSHYI